MKRESGRDKNGEISTVKGIEMKGDRETEKE